MNKYKLSIISNILIIIFEVIGFIYAIIDMHKALFLYYTQDSNLFLLIATCFYLYFLIKTQRNKMKIPPWITSLKYGAVVSVSVTFIIVITVLAPASENGYYFMLLDRSMLFHHTICPILAILSFIFLERHDLKHHKQVIRSLLFTLIYAIIILYLNIAKIIVGPYPFLHVYQQPIWLSILWVFIIFFGTYVIAYGLKILHNEFNN